MNEWQKKRIDGIYDQILEVIYKVAGSVKAKVNRGKDDQQAGWDTTPADLYIDAKKRGKTNDSIQKNEDHIKNQIKLKCASTLITESARWHKKRIGDQKR